MGSTEALRDLLIRAAQIANIDPDPRWHTVADWLSKESDLARDWLDTAPVDRQLWDPKGLQADFEQQFAHPLVVARALTDEET